MYICMDIGNTNIAIGVYNSLDLIHKFRLSTQENMTSDEYGIIISQLLIFNDIKKEDIEGFIVSSVVPKIDYTIKQMVKRYFDLDVISIEQGIKSGINIKLDNPKQLGADLLVGAVGACEKYGPKIMIIDIGTAMTFVYVNEKKEFIGGAIVPGIHTAFSNLVEKTSLLEEVGLDETSDILGKNTKTCIQSGMVFGWASIIEGMIKRYEEKLGDFKIVITGGEARFLVKHISKDIELIYDDDLLLTGLAYLYQKNK